MYKIKINMMFYRRKIWGIGTQLNGTSGEKALTCDSLIIINKDCENERVGRRTIITNIWLEIGNLVVSETFQDE